jgi:hypothetical protein
MTTETVVYLNLTNGVEAIEYFPHSSFVRIQSTHCEGKCYDTIFNQLSDNFLMDLAQGKKIVVIDGGVNDKMPKALRMGIKVIKIILNWVWFETPIDEEIYKNVYKTLREPTKRKLKYYKKFLNTDKISILTLGFHTEKDGDYEYYKEKIKAA